MWIRRAGQWLGNAVMGGPRHKPIRLDTVTLPDLIDWFLKNKDAKTDGVIAFSYVYKLPNRPPVSLHNLPEVDNTDPGLIVVQGFYNQATEWVVRSRAILAQRIDDEVAESHAGKDMVVYQ
jgi:hypothetical protein